MLGAGGVGFRTDQMVIHMMVFNILKSTYEHLCPMSSFKLIGKGSTDPSETAARLHVGPLAHAVMAGTHWHYFNYIVFICL